MDLQIKVFLNENETANTVASAVLVFEDEEGPIDIGSFHIFWRKEESDWVVHADPKLDLEVWNEFRKRIETAVLAAFHRQRKRIADA